MEEYYRLGYRCRAWNNSSTSAVWLRGLIFINIETKWHFEKWSSALGKADEEQQNNSWAHFLVI